jgi:hypothetical protein
MVSSGVLSKGSPEINGSISDWKKTNRRFAGTEINLRGDRDDFRQTARSAPKDKAEAQSRAEHTSARD